MHESNEAVKPITLFTDFVFCIFQDLYHSSIPQQGHKIYTVHLRNYQIAKLMPATQNLDILQQQKYLGFRNTAATQMLFSSSEHAKYNFSCMHQLNSGQRKLYRPRLRKLNQVLSIFCCVLVYQDLDETDFP